MELILTELILTEMFEIIETWIGLAELDKNFKKSIETWLDLGELDKNQIVHRNLGRLS